jgi:hypothetical protein
MFLQRLRETLQFFWQHLTELLWRLAPVALPFLLFSNCRLILIHHGELEKALLDPITMLPQMLAGVAATAFTIVYTLRQRSAGTEPVPRFTLLWRDAARGLPALAVVQVLAGLAIVGGFMLLILPGIFLMGALMPAYVLAVHERQAPIAALKDSWARFNGQAWLLGASILFLLPCLVIVVSGLGALEQLLNDSPTGMRIIAKSALDLLAMLFAQMPGILLVHYYAGEDKAVSR